MTIHVFGKLYKCISALILIACAAALLPAYRVSAQDQTVTIPKDVVDQSVWNANWNVNTSVPADRVQTLVFGSLLRAHGSSKIGLSALTNEVHRLLGPKDNDPNYRGSLSPDVIVQTYLEAASNLPEWADAVKPAWQELSSPLSVTNDATAIVAKSAQAYSFGQSVLGKQDQLLQEDVAAAKKDPEFAKAYDEVNQERLGTSIQNFDGKKFVAAHPNLPIPAQVRNNIQPDGTLRVSLNELKDLATTEFGKIDASLTDIQNTLKTIDANQAQLLDFMKNEQARQQAQALAQQKAQEHQLKLQAAESSVYMIATLAGFIDPKIGQQIGTVGQSAIQIGESLNGWLNAVAGLNTLDKITSLSTVVMTGNVLGAVMNVVGMFGDSQSPDQMILEEIGKLRQQVDQLRTEMHDRFDRVDQELNTIYTTMHERFDQIDLQLGKITTSLEEIQQSLLTISLQLNRMERNNFEFIDALGRRPLQEAINGAIGYKERTGLDMPYQPDFIGYENTFQTWGTINAFDALSAGPSVRDYSDAQVLAELSAYPLDANLNYLNGWLGAHGLTPIASKRLPSPRDWAFASRAYAQLGLDWPQHLQRISPQRQAALDAAGTQLKAALGNIATVATADGLKANTALSDGLFGYYTGKLNSVNSALQASEAGYLQEIQGQLQRGESFDMFGGIDQALSYQPADLSTLTCGGTKAGLPTPSNIKRIIPNYNRVALADYLKISGMSICLTTDLVNGVEDCVTYPGDQLPTCVTFWSPQATLTVWASGVAVGSTTVTSGSGYLNPDAEQIIRAEWGYFKARFEDQLASAQAGAPPAALAATDTTMTNRLISYQQTLYSRVVNGLNGGALQAPATELAGAKKLIDSFVTLGFPQAVGSDDFMRSLLFSEQRMPDDQEVLAAYSAARATPQQLTANPRLALIDGGQQRRAALDELLARYMTSTSAGTHSEDNPMISNTQFDMQLARKLATPNSAPTTSQRVFLPLVRH